MPTDPGSPRSVADLDLTPAGRVEPSPGDWRDRVIYQVLLDRFDDGGERPMFDPAHPLPGGRTIEAGRRWCGGTLAGLTRRLAYIHNLGADTLWISPPLKQRPGQDGSYHGYGIQDFLAVDPHFGTFADFRRLVDEAHALGMLVIMDVVIDHTADVWRYADGTKQWADGQVFDDVVWNDGDPEHGFTNDQGIWPREFQTFDAFKRMGEMRDVGSAHDAEAWDGDFMSLKVLDLTRDWVLDAIVRCHAWWIAKADVDGFRIDAFRHVRPEPARRFCQAIEEFAQSIGKSDFFLVGEVAAGESEMMRYVASNVPERGHEHEANLPRLDAVLDFEVHRKLDGILRGETSSRDMHARFDFLNGYYRDFGDAARHYVTFLEGHDQGDVGLRRLLHGFGSKSNERPGGDPRLAVAAHACLLLGWGIPCLYYGTEQCFDGGGEGEDTSVRECMFGGEFGPFGTTGVHFFDPGHPAYRGTARLTELRRRGPVFRFGRQYVRQVSGDGVHFGFAEHPGAVFAFSRVLADIEALVVVNPAEEARDVCVSVDAALTPPGVKRQDAWNDTPLTVEETDEGTAFVRLTLPPRGLAVVLDAARLR